MIPYMYNEVIYFFVALQMFNAKLLLTEFLITWTDREYMEDKLVR